MEHQYVVYGVTLRSDIPFAFPAEGSSRLDAHVAFVRGTEADFAAAAEMDAGGSWFVCRVLADRSTYLRWSSFYQLLVDAAGTRVMYRPLSDGDPAILENFLFGQALAFALVRQGIEPVHAAVVDMGGYAIGVLGDCTFGKSTLAGALLQLGHRLISDDLLVVGGRDERPVALPGPGRIKLRPDSARYLLDGASGGALLNPHTDKQVFRLDEQKVQRTEVPVRAIFVLPTPEERAASGRIEIRPVSRARLVHDLVRNSFVTEIDDRHRLRQNFCSNSRLASSVAGYALRYPAGIDHLPAIRRAIVDCLVHPYGKGGTQ